MINAFTKLQIDFIFSIRNYYKKKNIYEIFCSFRQMTNTKSLKGNRLLKNIENSRKLVTRPKTRPPPRFLLAPAALYGKKISRQRETAVYMKINCLT